MHRQHIYYWKCDRPAAFHGTQIRAAVEAELEDQLRVELGRFFDVRSLELRPGTGQGNHLTWQADIADKAMFIRVENGPERDGHLAVESAVIDQVRTTGVPTPKVWGCDASRQRVPFAWQALERMAAPDLNHWFKLGRLDTAGIASQIGEAIAHWQSLSYSGFGVIHSAETAFGQSLSGTVLHGCHHDYASYFYCRLEEHLHFLVQRGFLERSDDILTEIQQHHRLLQQASGCLVHKDLALWNVLGSERQIMAFIDFDDAISGDAMDDLSLLACFHDAAFLRGALDGYQRLRPLPEEHRRRFWLHLLRNMIVKAVIRVGAGYFDRDDAFFLIGSGSSGHTLREMTLSRLALALRGLREAADLDLLPS